MRYNFVDKKGVVSNYFFADSDANADADVDADTDDDADSDC